MKRLASLLVLFVLFGMAQGVWAGTHEEVARVARQFVAAINERNLDGVVALYADDAQRFSPFSPFRLEGKEAIRADRAAIFQAFPTIRIVPSHVSIRVYGDTTAVVTLYVSNTLTDRKGETRTVYNLVSNTLVKQAGKWLIVTNHVSRVPMSP